MMADPQLWPDSLDEARLIQERLRAQVVTEDRLGPVERVAGVDVHYAPDQGLTWAAIAVLRLSDLDLQESVLACKPTAFPYVPGFLSFREAPAILDALDRLRTVPDLLMVDGQGIAHPRRLGLACHVGLLADLPAIGVAKSRLVGSYREPGDQPGDRTPLRLRGAEIGAVLRTRAGTRPLFVSAGHRISLPTALDYVMRCTRRYRLPEPTRLADRLSRAHPGGSPRSAPAAADEA